jgi:hypothetical protein
MTKLFTNHRLVLGLCLSIVYLPGVLNRGIWSDDYFTLADPSAHQLHATKDGRPLLGYVFLLLFGRVGSIDSLWVVRVVGLVGILLFADLVFQYLSKANWDTEILISLIVAFSIPAFQFGAHFATSFYIGWVGYISLQCLRLIESEKSRNYAFGAVLFVIPFLIYPLLTFFVFPLIFLKWYLLGAIQINSLVWSLLRGAISLVIGLAVSMLSNILFLRILGLEFNSRVGLISFGDIPAQLFWFVSRPFALSFRPFLISSPDLLEVLIQVAVVILLLLSFFSLNHNSFRKGLRLFLCFLVSLVLSISSIFFPNQQQIEIRFVIVGTWFVTFLIVFFTTGLLKRLFVDRISPNVLLNSMLAFSLLFSIVSVNDRYFNVINPIRINSEYFIKTQLSECLKHSKLGDINIIPRQLPWPSLKNLGMYSQVTDLSSEWVPLPAALLFARELTDNDSKLNVSWSLEETADSCNIDLNLYEGAS